MREVIFFDVDTQYDFMHRDGKFYVPDAERIIPNLKKITQFAKKKNVSVIASADKHKISDWKIASRIFPKIHITGALGQKKIRETMLNGAVQVPNRKLNDKKIKQLKEKNRIIIEKQEHNAFSNPNLKQILNGTKKAYVYGVATDYCVKAAVLELRKMEVKTYIIIDAIKPLFEKNEKKNLALFRKKGAKFLTTSQLLKRKVL